jgi:NADH:ubiquinone reductase (H+-translocating)
MHHETRHRVVILGGGFGGVFTAKRLRRDGGSRVEVVLISRHNFFVFQPFLPEVAGGSITPSDGVTPLRRFLPDVEVMVAEVREIDLGAKAVRVTVGRDSEVRTVPYDQLVIALGQVVDLTRMPGLADRAFVMKDVMDAFRIRNQVLGCLEDADATTEPRRRRSLLTFVVIGGGFTGVETVGELQELIRKSLKYYPNIRPDEIRTILIQYGSRILPELPEHLATYAAEKLRRRGIEIRLNTGVKAATPAGVETDSGPPIDAETIVAAIGNAPSPLLQSLPVTMERGRIVVDRFMRVRGQEDAWALGDNAHIPLGDPNRANVAYAPPLAQFAFREAKVLARNILAHVHDRPLTAFEYRSLGTMAALGGRSGVADILGVRISGFPAWVAWRLFYLSQLPGIATRLRVAADWLLELLVSRSIAEIRAAQPGSRHVRFLAGELVIAPGIDPGGVYIVTGGMFEVGANPNAAAGDPDDRALSTRKVGPGGHFGMPLNGAGTATNEWVRASQDSLAYFIGKDDLQRLAVVSALIERGPNRNTSSRPAPGDDVAAIVGRAV